MKPPKKGGGSEGEGSGSGGSGVSLPEGANPSHTLMGIPSSGEGGGPSVGGSGGEDKVDEAVGGSTMFGMGTRNKSGPLGGRRPQGKGVRQTLMGLGSVRVLNEPGEEEEGSGGGGKAGGGRMTMTGMPGVRVKGRGGKKKKGKSGKAKPRNTMQGMPAIKESGGGGKGSGKSPVLSAGNYVLKPGGGSGEGATVEVDDAQMEKARELAAKQKAAKEKAAAEEARRADARKAEAEAAATEAAEEEPVGIPEVEEDDDFDPLAGFAGAGQVKVSSLMDEEVDDLSAQVFGDDFAFGEDDLDFDDDFDDEFDDFDFADSASESSEAESHLGKGDVPEEDVHHDTRAAASALGDMMADLEDVMPTEDEAAAGLGLDESMLAEGGAPEGFEEAGGGGGFEIGDDFEDEVDDEGFGFDDDGLEIDEDPTIADADYSAKMAELSTRSEEEISEESAAVPSDEVPVVEDEAPAPRAPFEKPAVKKKEAPAPPAAAVAGSPDTVGFGLGGAIGVIGGLLSAAWLAVPVSSGELPIAMLGEMKPLVLSLSVVSLLSVVLAFAAAAMKLPSMSKGLVLALLGIGIFVLTFAGPLASTSPHNFFALGGAGLLLLGGLVYFVSKPKPG